MPATLQYSHDILRGLAEVRHSGECAGAASPTPRARSPCATRTAARSRCLQIVVCHPAQEAHRPARSPRPSALEHIEPPYRRGVFPEGLITKKTKWHVNPTGRFEIGGPDGDAGLTGRKIIVDTYGGAAPHGGGAFSGKDPTKVDRSAAYACRYLAKNVVAAGLADKCTIQISYAIGVAQPLSFYVDLHDTGEIDPAKLEKALPEMIGGATPRAIREHLGLNRPIYARTAAYGHFGRQPDNEGGFSWETHRPGRRAEGPGVSKCSPLAGGAVPKELEVGSDAACPSRPQPPPARGGRTRMRVLAGVVLGLVAELLDRLAGLVGGAAEVAAGFLDAGAASSPARLMPLPMS